MSTSCRCDRRRRIAILGATGSIGRNAVAVASAHPERFEVECVTCRSRSWLLREAAENTANLRSLDFCLTDDQGGTYEAGAGSVVSMGTGENENSYLLESPWFQDGKHFTLHIRGAQFLTKGKEWVRVDLQAKTIEGLPDGAALDEIRLYDDTWQVSVRTDSMPKGTARRASLFGSEYHNEDGTIQGYTGRGYSGGDGGWEYVTLEDYPEDVVYLKLSHDRTVLLPQSLDIPIN